MALALFCNMDHLGDRTVRQRPQSQDTSNAAKHVDEFNFIAHHEIKSPISGAGTADIRSSL